MAEHRKGLCYYYDDKYSLGHKFKEPKFFQIDVTNHSSSEEAPPLEGLEEEYEDTQQKNELPAMPEEPVISLHALVEFFVPQNLKIRGFIKHRHLVVLIDSGSTHNFIHQRVTEAVHFFFGAIYNF